MKVAWFSFFPVEWLADAPAEVRALPRQHPATWQRVLLAEFERSPDLKLHVFSLRKEHPRDRCFERNGVTFHLVRTRGGLRAPSLFWYDTVVMGRELKAVRPDVVHAWGTENGAATVAARLRYPSVVTIQGLASWNIKLFPVTGYERLAAWLERWNFRGRGLVTAESRFACDYVRQLGPRLEVRHVDTVPARLFHEIERRPSVDRFRVLFTGHLGPRKGGDLLVRALDQLRGELDLELVVIGDSSPDFVSEMKAVTSAELWSRIQFRQNLTPEEVAGELAQATLFACPTRADTGPTAAKEAAVAGVPIVGAEVGGVPDYVVPGQNGFLCAPGSVESLRDALRQAARHPLLGRGVVAADVLRELRARLDPARMAAEFRAAYVRAMERQGVR